MSDGLVGGFRHFLEAVLPTLLLLFHARVPILALLFLGTVGVVAKLTPLGSLLSNAFVVHASWQLFCTTIICVLASAFCAAIYRNIEFNGIERFLRIPLDVSRARPDPFTPITPVVEGAGDARLQALPWKRLSNAAQLLLTVAFGLSIPLVCWWHSATHDTLKAPWYEAVFALVAGMVVAAGVVYGTCWAVDWLFPSRLQITAMTGWDRGELQSQFVPGGWGDRIGRLIARIGQGPGYGSRSADLANNTSPEYLLHPGHGQLIVSTLVLALIYVLAFVFSGAAGTDRDEDALLPTVAYIVFVLMIVTSVFSSLAFFLDYYRVPVLLFVAAVLVLNHLWPWKKSIAFSLPEAKVIVEPGTLVGAVTARMKSAKSALGEKPVLIVVTSPGGGIHASAWAARVLTGLSERYEKDRQRFVRCLGIVSGVSGGGVGNRYFVDMLSRLDPQQLDSDTDAHRAALAEARNNVNKLAQFSSLDAIGWGLAFPDLFHVINPLPVDLADIKQGIPRDRGDALEKSWNHRMKTTWQSFAAGREGATTLNSLAERTASGELPIVVWSATDVYSGKRVVIAPVADGTLESNDHAVDLYKMIRNAGKTGTPRDLDVSTAARLAATFPYVTPIVGPETPTGARVPDELAALRLTDGGFFDNEGIVTAARWIERILVAFENTPPEDRPFDKIVLVRIDPSPLDVAAKSPPPKTWKDAILSAVGPLFALANVRSSSQVDRGNLEADLFVGLTRMRLRDNYESLLLALEKEHELPRDVVDSVRSGAVELPDLVMEKLPATGFDAKPPDSPNKAVPQTAATRSLAEALREIMPLVGVDSARDRELLYERAKPLSDAVRKPTSLGAGDSMPPEKSVPTSAPHIGKDRTIAADSGLGAKLSKAAPTIALYAEKAQAIRRTHVDIQQVRIPFRLPVQPDQAGQGAEVEPPLSWALSERERRMYDAAWKRLVDEADAFEASPHTSRSVTTTPSSSPVRPPLSELHELLTR